MISHETDVVVIGPGVAGLRGAIALDEQHARVLVVGKQPRDDAHTLLALGAVPP